MTIDPQTIPTQNALSLEISESIMHLLPPHEPPPQTVSELLDYRMKDGATLAHLAAIEGAPFALMKLAELGLCLDIEMLNGLTPVHAAAVNGHTACLKILASHGCHLESCCYQGWSAVHLAAYNGHLDCLKYLHEQACNMTLKKNNGDTPLTCAAEQSQLDCVSFLQYLADDSTDTHPTPYSTDTVKDSIIQLFQKQFRSTT